MLEFGENFVYWIGCYALASYLYENLKSPLLMLGHKLCQRCGLWRQQSLAEKYGRWAVITGATDGIGKAYARELARRGLNVVLISRSAAKLQNVANEIAIDFAVQTRTIVADFTHGASVYEHIESQLGELPFGIWVNNVGQFTSLPGNMANFDAEELAHLVHTNVMAVTQLSRTALRHMARAHIKGAIVNISSGLETFPCPLATVYAASKAYTRSLTLALQQEARPSGVRVQLVSPGFVITKLNSHAHCMKRSSLLVPTAQRYASSAVDTLCHGIDETTGFVWHGATMAVVRLLPLRICSQLWRRGVELLADELKAP